MKIAKLGHCCLVIEENGLRIMTDPGIFSTAQNDQQNIDVVLITHEHQDHFHLDSLKVVLSKNPQAVVITNSAVGKLLDEAGIKYEKLEHGETKTIKNVNFEGHGQKHAVIYEDYGQVENTGFMIADKFFYPGDAFYNPGKQVDVLGLPVAGPWVKISEAIDYAKEVKPKAVFPVHDGTLNSTVFPYRVLEMYLSKVGIRFEPMTESKEVEF